MKTFLVLVLSIVALFVWQRQGAETATGTKAPKAASAPAQVPQPRPVSEHNWAKNSLDRAHAVADQVQQTREQNDQR
ncbi:MAG TPA: hypothetical protein VGL24_12375 [Chthoniobacterales bacterium]